MNLGVIRKGSQSQPSLCFYNHSTKQIQSNIWNELEGGLWREYNITNRLLNMELGVNNICKWESLFNSIIPIYPGFQLDYDNLTLKEILYKPCEVEATYESFLRVSKNFFSKYKGKTIGVHLSGGFDSSLIICLLHYLQIPFYLVGLTSNRYEHRTERVIQDKLIPYSLDAKLIDAETVPFYSNLKDTPKHQIPDSFIKMNDASRAIACAMKSFGVDIVLTGQGGDSLFTEDLSSIKTFKGYNIQNEFTFPWEKDLIYSPLGLELVSYYSDKTIIDQITNLRIGQRSDPLKWWARNFFKKILPFELSEYAYFGDFNGLSMTGLIDAKKDIKELFEETYEIIKHPLFSPISTKRFLKKDILSFSHVDYSAYCTQISIAVWIHSLFREY